MKIKLFNFNAFFMFMVALFATGDAFSAQQPNPRSAVGNVSNLRTENKVVSRGSGGLDVADGNMRTSVVRSATNSGRAIERSVVRTENEVVSRLASGSDGRSGVARSAVRPSATSIARSVSLPNSSRVRSASVVSDSRVARAADLSRATAVFTDVSKIGGGYSQCREAYATCMDQFCANANDTYRRCYCSQRFTEFRDTELALDEAKTLLMQFEDNNLNAVDKTAAEVDAMYSATVGEAAIKKDTSAAQSVLNEISDLLSGKKKSSVPENSNMSMGIMAVDFSADVGDIWGEGVSSIFDSGTGVDLTALEGVELFNASNKQCLQLIADNCENNAVLNMATSAYGIMIAQDCNLYEKKIDSQREAVKQTVRQAEKYLREARLEEYRAHNSADVNECLEKVRAALLSDVACGANYKRCLDYSGVYINSATGDAIYSPRLFQLENLISLDGTSSDVLGQNADFNKFLDSKKMFATSALDTCRDISDIVWTEFKRSALIEIAQAQDEKIEEVKMSCVSTMAECYDTQSGALRDFDTTTAKTAGALSAYAARDLCQDKVIACASLYGDTDGCNFDGNGKLVTGNAQDGSARCGLTSLLAFVESVDNVRVIEGCESALVSYLNDLCTPERGDVGYPWNCRNMTKEEIRDNVSDYAKQICSDPVSGNLPVTVTNQIDDSIYSVSGELEYLLAEQCGVLGGYWVTSENTANENGTVLLDAFYRTVFSGNATDEELSFGRCVENTTRVRCLAYNTGDSVLATYNAATDECVFVDAWYQNKCMEIGGFYEGGICFVGQEERGGGVK